MLSTQGWLHGRLQGRLVTRSEGRLHPNKLPGRYDANRMKVELSTGKE